MIGKRTAIWKREEYSYESEERDIPYVISYMHEDGQIRPAMIVVPGGAYRHRKAISSHEHFIGPDTMRLYLHTV
jgi:hypothetical protein